MIHHKPDQQLCEDDKLIAVLRDGEDAAQHQEVVEHIEQCSRCQQRFDELAAGAQDWTKARQALLNDDPCSENRVGSAKWGYSLRNEGPVAWTESMASQLLSPASHPELLGRLGRYDVERLIGSGGMGIVFKAHDSELNRPVAIKILAPYLSSSGPARKRFAREARAAAAVVHEHVVPIYNVETEREVPFLVMHYIAGESLQGRIDREGALELCEILRIGMQVASGLSAAHQQGLVHRDIKPSNILMEQGVERALITDFGLARAADDASLTRTGFHPGTPQYMSPEQAAGEQVDSRSDLFSLGSLLYTMCTGRPPFRAETSLGVLRRITDIEPRPIREINPNIPEWLCEIISKLMAKQADDRFTSAQEVAELLEDCLAHVQQPTSSPLPSSLVPHAATVRRSVSNVTRAGVMIMLGTLGISLLGMFLWQATDPPDISGQWTSDEWGTVVLKAKEPGQYKGTFNGPEKVGPASDGEKNSSNKVPDKGASGTSTPQSAVEAIPPGKLHVKWSAIERRFNGTWETGDHTKGKISLRLVDNEIRGACTSTSDSRKVSTSPQLTDLLWKRSGGTSTSIIAAAEKEYQSTIPKVPDSFLDRLQGTWRTKGEPMFVWEVFATGINETVFDAKGNVRSEEWLIKDEGNLNDTVSPARIELMAKDPKTGGFSGLTGQKCLLAVDGDSLVCSNSLAGDYPNEIAKGPRQSVREFRRDKEKPLELLGDWIVDDWERGSGDESVLKSDDIDFPKYTLRFHSDRFWLRALNDNEVESPDQGMMGYGDVREYQWSIPGESRPGEFLLTVQSENRTQLLYGRYQLMRTRPQAKPDRLQLTISRKPLSGDLPSASGWHFKCHRATTAIDPSGSRVFDDRTKSLDTRKSTTAELEFKQLELAEEDLRTAYGNAIENAKSDEDRERAENQFDARDAYTPEYLAFEEKYRGTPAGLKALIKVVGFARSTWISPASAGRVEAVNRLIDHYVAFDGIEQAFDHLRGGVPVPREKELLKAVVEKNPSRHAQAESLIAQLELIRVTLSRHANIESLRERVLHPEEHYPDLWRENEKAVLRELESTNPDQLRAEMKAIIERLEEFSLVPVAKYGMAYKAARHLSHSINKVVIGKPAPEIKAITSVGKQFQLSKLRGSTVLLVFGLNHSSDNDVMYAPLRKLADDYKSRHVEVVMILESEEDTFQSAAALKRQFPWTVIQEPSAGSLSLDWGVRGYPTVFFIDAKGILQSWTVGLPCYDEDSGYDATEVAAELDKLLASKQSHNNDGSKGPIDVKPGSSEPLGANEPQVLPAITVPDSSPPADTMKIDNRAGDSEQSTREQSTMPPIEFDTMEKLPGNERDSAESRFANEPSWASSSVVSNNTLDGIWDVVEINWCGQVWISNGAQVLIENGKWVGFDPHETEDPTQNIRRDFAIGPDNEFCRIETDGKLRYLQPGRFRLEADQLWLAVQQCSLPSETPIRAIPTVSEPNVTYYRLRRRKAGGQEENTNVTRKQSGAKNSALFNRQTIEDITRLYNDNTAVLRRELFQPPIQDLTVEQMRAALRLAAEIETRDGRPKTGKLLEKFAESGVLSRKNGELLSYGTHEMDENGNTIARMIVPTFLIVNADGPKDERGQLDKEPVVLTSLSLSYRKNGYASKTYEYLTEAKDTLEGFLKPGRELFDKEMKQIGERLAKVVEGSAEHSLLTTKKKQVKQQWDLSVAQVKGMAAAAKAGKPVQLAPIVIPNNSRPWQAPMPDPLLGHDEEIANVLAGTWQLKRYMQDAEEALFEGSVTFSKSMMIVHLKQGDKQEELQQMYRIGSEKIDLWDMDDGLDIRTSLPHLGSYSIENDTLRICYHESPMEDDVPQARPPVRPGKKLIFLELQRNVVAEKVNVAKGKTNYADLQGDWIVDSFYVDKDANSRELQKLGSTALLLRTIRVEADELFFRNPPVAGMSRISGAISIKPAEGDDSRLFQVIDSRVPGEAIRFGMYKVVGDKLTILLTRDAPPKLLAPTEGEFYIECHRAVSEEDKELLTGINKNPDQINVIALILKDSEKSVSAKEDTIATENVSGSETPSATRAPDANGIYWSSRNIDHWVSGIKVLQWPNAVTRKLIVEFVLRNDSPETREVDVHLYCGNKTSLLLSEGNNASVDIKETRREKQTAVPNGVLTFKEVRAEISFEGLEAGEYTLRFQRVMDLQLDDDGLPRGVSRHGVPFDVSLPVKFDSSQDNLPIYWGKPVAGLRIGAMFLDSRKDHMRSFKPRDQAASQLFVQNVGSKEVECGFAPPYHSGGWGVEIADKVGQRISGVWKDEPRRVGVLIPPPPMWARLAPNEIQPISGEFTKFRVRDDDDGGTTHYEHAKFTIVAEKPEELRALPPHDYLMPTGEYNALFSATLRKAESPNATIVLESGPCPFRVVADGTATLSGTETSDKAGTIEHRVHMP